jgi:hypothetical protein
LQIAYFVCVSSLGALGHVALLHALRHCPLAFPVFLDGWISKP